MDIVIAYYAVIITVLLFTLPLAGKKLAFAPVKGVKGYSPLRGMTNNGRHATLVGMILIYLVLVVLCVNKPEFIADRAMYEMMYDMGGGEKIKQGIEPSFVILTELSPTFIVLLAIYALLSVGAHITGIALNSPNIWLSLFTYISYTFVLHDMIQMRAAVAIGLLLMAVRYIVERRMLLYFAFVALASFFHYSAMIFFVFYFFPTKSLNKWVWTVILIVGVVAAAMNMQFGYISKFLPIGFIQSYVESYLGNKVFDATELGPFRIFKVFVAIIMLFGQKQIKRHYPLCIPVLMFFICSQLAFLLLGDIPVLQGRFGEMFAAFDIFALAMFPLISKKYYYLLFVVPIAIVIYHHIAAYDLLTSVNI